MVLCSCNSAECWVSKSNLFGESATETFFQRLTWNLLHIWLNLTKCFIMSHDSRLWCECFVLLRNDWQADSWLSFVLLTLLRHLDRPVADSKSIFDRKQLRCSFTAMIPRRFGTIPLWSSRTWYVTWRGALILVTFCYISSLCILFRMRAPLLLAETEHLRKI